MKTRTQLEEILAQQRRARPPVPRKRGKYLISALAVIAILTASGVVMFIAVDFTTPTTETTALPSTSPTVHISKTLMAREVVMRVCTDIPDGRLHVRFAAGNSSEVRGYLTEGEAVLAVLASDGAVDSQIIRGNTWLRISSPIAGWVNARYLCKSE